MSPAAALETGDIEYPLLTAVMVTGKHPARYPLARIAIDCFLKQTYPNKELLIVNDGDRSFEVNDVQVREVRLARRKRRTLGALRNIGLRHSRGRWVIQWDDDDWHAPERMEVQMRHRQPEAAVLLKHQIRYDFTSGCALVASSADGLHGTVLHSASPGYRYLELAKGEDTLFLHQLHHRILVENDPVLYVRFFHGLNTWDRTHVMQRLAQERDQVDLTDAHRHHLLRRVLPLYAKEFGP